jgi:hypothetical protein
MKISVEATHIVNGVERHSQHCMIADAIKAAVPGAQYIMVDLQSIRWSDPVAKQRYTYLTPPIAQRNLLRFDQGKPVMPFTFSLNTPHKTRAAGWEGQRSKGATRTRSSKQHKAKYAYLEANRSRWQQKEREFGLRKFAQ